MLRITKKLSYNPSTFIREALEDLEKAEKGININDKSNYLDTYYDVKINMNRWCDFNTKTDVCQVCLAGSVMLARTNPEDIELFLRENEDTSISPPKYDDYEFSSRLWALDYFRKGQIEEGLDVLGIKINFDIDDMDVIDYSISPESFKKDMLKVADKLEDLGF